eukprot:g8406.t1
MSTFGFALLPPRKTTEKHHILRAENPESGLAESVNNFHSYSTDVGSSSSSSSPADQSASESVSALYPPAPADENLNPRRKLHASIRSRMNAAAAAYAGDQQQPPSVHLNGNPGNGIALGNHRMLTSHEERRRLKELSEMKNPLRVQDLFFQRGQLHELMEVWQRRGTESDISKLCISALENCARVLGGGGAGYTYQQQQENLKKLLTLYKELNVLKNIFWSLEVHFYRRDHQVVALGCLNCLAEFRTVHLLPPGATYGSSSFTAVSGLAQTPAVGETFRAYMQDFFNVQYRDLDSFSSCMCSQFTETQTQSGYVIGHLIRGRPFSGISLLLLVLKELVLRVHDGHNANNGAFSCNEADMAKTRAQLCMFVFSLLEQLLDDGHEKNRVLFLSEKGLQILCKAAKHGFHLVRSGMDYYAADDAAMMLRYGGTSSSLVSGYIVAQDLEDLIPAWQSPRNSPSPLKVWSDSDDDFLPDGPSFLTRPSNFGRKKAGRGRASAAQAIPPPLLGARSTTTSAQDHAHQPPHTPPRARFSGAYYRDPSSGSKENDLHLPQDSQYLTPRISRDAINGSARATASGAANNGAQQELVSLTRRFQDRLRKLPGGAKFFYELLANYMQVLVKMEGKLLFYVLSVLAMLLDQNEKNCTVFLERHHGLNLLIGVFSLYTKTVLKAGDDNDGLSGMPGEGAGDGNYRGRCGADAIQFLQCNFLNLAKVSEMLPEKTQSLLLQFMPEDSVVMVADPHPATTKQQILLEGEQSHQTRLQFLLDFIDEFYFSKEVQAMSCHFLVKFFYGRPYQRHSEDFEKENGSIPLSQALSGASPNRLQEHANGGGGSGGSYAYRASSPGSNMGGGGIDLIDVYGGELMRKKKGGKVTGGELGCLNRAPDNVKDLALPAKNKISPSKRKKQFLYLMDLFLTNVENFPSDSTLVGHALHACKLLLDTDQEFRKQCADAIDVDERVAFKLEDNEKLQTKLLEHALPAIARQINDAYVPGKIGADPMYPRAALSRTCTAVEYGLEIMLLCHLSRTMKVAKLLDLDLPTVLSAVIKQNSIDVRLRFQVEKLHRSIEDALEKSERQAGENFAQKNRWTRLQNFSHAVDPEMASMVKNLVQEEEEKLFFRRGNLNIDAATSTSTTRTRAGRGAQSTRHSGDVSRKRVQFFTEVAKSALGGGAGGGGLNYNAGGSIGGLLKSAGPSKQDAIDIEF